MKKLQKRKTLLRALFIAVIMLILFTANTAFAAGEDPETIANNFLTFIFVIVRVVGVAILVFGFVQLGLSFKSHDPSQRGNAMLSLAGGIIIVLAKEILILIGIEI